MSSQSFFRASFASLVVAFASSAFAQKQQVIVDADFSKSTVTSAESDSVTVGNVTFMSTKKALSVVELEGGRKVLRIRPQNNVQVRVVFPATPAVVDQVLAMQMRLQFPSGAPEKGGILRFGLYDLKTPTDFTAVAADQGIWTLTSPGAKNPENGTTFIRDNLVATGDGKFPGALGGGGGTTSSNAKLPSENFGSRPFTALFSLQPVGTKTPPAWQVDLMIASGDDRIKGTHRFGETAIFAPTSFNVAAFSLGAGDIVYLDGFTVMKISKK